MSIGGQSAPPSLKQAVSVVADVMLDYRGAVRPPFIEADAIHARYGAEYGYRGAVRPPFIEACD